MNDAREGAAAQIDADRPSGDQFADAGDVADLLFLRGVDYDELMLRKGCMDPEAIAARILARLDSDGRSHAAPFGDALHALADTPIDGAAFLRVAEIVAREYRLGGSVRFVWLND